MPIRSIQRDILFLILVFPLPLPAQPDYSKSEVQTFEITPGLYVLATGHGGNVGVSIGSDGVLLIDDEMTPLTPKIIAALTKLTEKKVRFVLNTHWHFDHTGGNESLGKGGSVIIAHANVRKRMEKGQFMEAFNMEVPPAPAIALPVVTFTENVTVHFNGDTLEVVHPAPAHTDGDAIVYFRKANVVHMGDVFWNGIYPFIDAGSGGSTAGVIEAAASVLQRIDDDTQVIPGHGPMGNKDQLQAYHDMIKTVHSRIVQLKKGGKSIDEIVAAQPSGDFDEEWGKGLFTGEQWVRMVHSTL